MSLFKLVFTYLISNVLYFWFLFSYNKYELIKWFITAIWNEVIDDLIKLLKEAQNKLNEGNFDDTQMYYLKVAFSKTLTLVNLYLKNFNEFIKDQNN